MTLYAASSFGLIATVMSISLLTVLVTNTIQSKFNINPLWMAFALAHVLCFILILGFLLAVICGIAAFGLSTGLASVGGRIVLRTRTNGPSNMNSEYHEPASISPPKRHGPSGSERKPNFGSRGLGGPTIVVRDPQHTPRGEKVPPHKANLPAVRPSIPMATDKAKPRREFWTPWI